MKSYTDLEQSKKLEEILPLDSADMKWYFWKEEIDAPKLPTFGYSKNASESYKNTEAVYLPCWSLAALLGVLPKGTNISTPCPINELSYCCWNQHYEIYASNPIDACYKMVCWLKENGKL